MDPRLAAYLELSSLPERELARRLYRLVVRRDPDPDGQIRAETALGDGTLSPAALVAELVASDEFTRVRALDDAVAFAAWARAAGERPRGLGGPAGCDERVIEIPWALARYRGEAAVLDAGYAFAEPAWLAALAAAAPGDVTGIDLSEADVPGYRQVVGDLRRQPFENGSFAVAFCISTLEHVGRDNAQYGIEAEGDPGGMAEALTELRRVLARNGRLVLSVPAGAREERAEFVQLGAAEWLDLFRDSGFLVHEHELYELDEDGWRSVAELDPTLGYGTQGPGAVGLLVAELHPAAAGRRLRAVARRIRA